MEFERALEMPELQLVGTLSGYAPVQARGTIAGKAFYFRARHGEWTFSVSPGPDQDPVDIQLPGQGFLREGEFGKRSDASWMDFDLAEELVRRCAREFLATDVA